VITCDIQIARELCAEEGIDVVVLGGVLRKAYYYSYGYYASSVLENLRADKFLLGADAVRVPGGITNSSIDEVVVKQSCIKSSNEVFLVADSSKFKLSAPYRVCAWEDIDWIVTDDEADPRYLEFFQHQGLKVLLASTTKGREYELIQNPNPIFALN
jgi:DeoR/GlpR family transcriptional regulator of sugar metabolism